MKPTLPFRLGSTSYVIPADILPNVRHLARWVDDIELVLFEVNDESNLPSTADVAELSALADAHDLTYTVHLPLDLRLAADDDHRRRHPSLDKARRVIRATRPLNPWAYVVHLDGAEIAPVADLETLARWQEQARRSLEIIGQELGDPGLIALENLENYDPAAFLPLLEQLPISLCVDVGHLLKNRKDSLSYLLAHVKRTRVIHLHGVRDGRDHRGLEHLPDGLLAELLDRLVAVDYRGVLTLEVFAEHHFSAGRERVLALMEGRA
jgi:sugar phosphate isomerase/epimerase